MSMEAILETTAVHSPNFDPAFAMGRIHSILSALIQYCRTRAAYLYTGCFACELHIRPGGTALVPSVVPDIEVKMELRVGFWFLNFHLPSFPKLVTCS
jgi:hypothetical protein